MPKAKININREQIAQFVLNNKKQVIIGGVLLLVVFIMLAVLFKLNHDFINQTQGEQDQQQTGSKTTNSPDSGSGAVSTYLPDTSRKIEDNREVRDPFSRGMMLKGIITGGSGGNLAIIESGSTAFVVGPGDEIAGGWTVAEIKRNAVILKMGIHKMQLEFNGRVKDLTLSAAPSKTATDQPAARDNDADKEAPRDTTDQSSAPTSGEKTLQQDNQPSEPAGKEGVQDDR